MDNNIEKNHIHVIGMRNIKTACAAALCVLLYFFIHRAPTFACIGAIFGMGNDLTSSRQNGGNRLFGTIIGGILGMLLFRIYIIYYPDGKSSLLMMPLAFIGVILLIILCQIFWKGGVQPGGVMLCIIMFNTPVDTYIVYSLNRILDTAVGVMVALIVNSVLPGGFTFEWMKTMFSKLKKNESDTLPETPAQSKIKIN